MKYIRTKDGQIIDLKEWQHDKYNECYFNKKYRLQDNVYQNLIYDDEIVKQADKLEELIQTGDLVEFEARNYLKPVVAQIKVNKVSYIENGIELSVPGCMFGTQNVNAWWIQLPNGDFHKVAIKNSEGELKLL